MNAASYTQPTPALVQALVEELARSGVAFEESLIQAVSDLVIKHQGCEGEIALHDRIRQAEDVINEDPLYLILPLKRHSVTIVQKIQVSVQAVSNEHAYELAKRLNNPLKHGEVFDTQYEDAYLQDT